MADSPAFDELCAALEERTPFDRLESRGTVRLALKQAGLEASSVTGAQLEVVVDRLLPAELVSRGISDPDSITSELRRVVSNLDVASANSNSPEAVFARLGGSV